MASANKQSRAGSLNVAVLVACTLLAGGSLAFVTVQSVPAPQQNAESPEQACLFELRLCDFGPEELTAAGVDARLLDRVVAAGADHIRRYGSFMPLIDASRAADGRYDVLRQRVESGEADVEERSMFETAIAAKASAVQSLESAKNRFLSAAFAGLDAGVRRRAEFAAKNARYHVPAEFRLEDRSEAEWLALRNACAAERIAIKHGKNVPTETAALLAHVRAAPASVSAKAALSTHLMSVKNAFDQPVARR